MNTNPPKITKLSDLTTKDHTWGKAPKQLTYTLNRQLAFIGTGGTVASIGKDPEDLLDYNETEIRLGSADVLEFTGLRKFASDHLVSEFIPIDSTAITHTDWTKIAKECDKMRRLKANGIVIGHGTATLEETAWLLYLVLNLNIPVVVTGSMRPLNGMSSDAAVNLLQSFYLAARGFDPGREEFRALVAMNGKIHLPSKVTKTHTAHLDAFKSGEIGYMCGKNVEIILPRKVSPRRPEIDEIEKVLNKLPRVDIVYSYIGADDTAVKAFIEKDTKGIISAGFHPGLGTESQDSALATWVTDKKNDKERGYVIQSTREGNGPVYENYLTIKRGFIAGNTYNPQKAKILLQVCLARGFLLDKIKKVFRAQRPEEVLWVP